MSLSAMIMVCSLALLVATLNKCGSMVLRYEQLGMKYIATSVVSPWDLATVSISSLLPIPKRSETNFCRARVVCLRHVRSAMSMLGLSFNAVCRERRASACRTRPTAGCRQA